MLIFHPTSFPSETSSATYMYCFLQHIQHHSYLLYITFIRTKYLFYLHDIPLFYFFGSSWQAGCPRSLVSVTVSMFAGRMNNIVWSLVVLKFASRLKHFCRNKLNSGFPGWLEYCPIAHLPSATILELLFSLAARPHVKFPKTHSRTTFDS